MLIYYLFFKVLFQEWRDFPLGAPFESFYSALLRRLNHENASPSGSKCNNFPGIDELLTKGIKSLI